jgi:hypothetical protein
MTVPFCMQGWHADWAKAGPHRGGLLPGRVHVRGDSTGGDTPQQPDHLSHTCVPAYIWPHVSHMLLGRAATPCTVKRPTAAVSLYMLLGSNGTNCETLIKRRCMPYLTKLDRYELDSWTPVRNYHRYDVSHKRFKLSLHAGPTYRQPALCVRVPQPTLQLRPQGRFRARWRRVWRWATSTDHCCGRAWCVAHLITDKMDERMGFRMVCSLFTRV